MIAEPLADPPSEGQYDISVLTPSFRYGRFLGTAIESALTSSSLAVEHIVQDGGSDDDTVAVLKRQEDVFGSDLKWESEPDEGQSDALNRALAQSSGRWIAWLNADEFYLPGGLEALVAEGDRSGADVVYGDAVFVDEDGRMLRLKPQHPFNKFVLRNYGAFISSCSTIFRRDALWQNPWDMRLQLLMDHDLYLKLAQKGARFHYVAYPVAAFRVHRERVSAEPAGSFSSDYAWVFSRHGRGGVVARWTAWLLHAGYKAVSGGYLRQLKARGLRARNLTWLRGPEEASEVERFFRRSYRVRVLS